MNSFCLERRKDVTERRKITDRVGGEEIDVIFKEDFSLPSPYDSLRQGRVFVTPAGRYRVSVPLHGVLPDRGVRAFDIDPKADTFGKVER